MQLGFLMYLSEILRMQGSVNLVLKALKILTKIFDREKLQGERDYYLQFEQMGGVDVVESLQGHSNQSVYELSKSVLVGHGEGEEV